MCATYLWRSSTDERLYGNNSPAPATPGRPGRARHLHFGVIRIGRRSEFETCSRSLALQTSDFSDQTLCWNRYRVCASSSASSGLVPMLLDFVFRHARAVKIADFLVGRRSAGGSFRFLGHLLEVSSISLVQFVEAPPARLIARDRVVFQPGPAGVLIKIGAGIRRFINRAKSRPLCEAGFESAVWPKAAPTATANINVGRRIFIGLQKPV